MLPLQPALLFDFFNDQQVNAIVQDLITKRHHCFSGEPQPPMVHCMVLHPPGGRLASLPCLRSTNSVVHTAQHMLKTTLDAVDVHRAFMQPCVSEDKQLAVTFWECHDSAALQTGMLMVSLLPRRDKWHVLVLVEVDTCTMATVANMGEQLIRILEAQHLVFHPNADDAIEAPPTSSTMQFLYFTAAGCSIWQVLEVFLRNN
jgi:hypothetical protein